MFEKIIIITKKTSLELLVEKFNSRSQARFYIEHSGGSFAEYEEADAVYKRALDALRSAIPDGVRHQFVERSFLPNFLFGPEDLVVTLGPDGLVVNTAKYLDGQHIFAINPDPARIDGVLLPYAVQHFRPFFTAALEGRFASRAVTMAEAELNDGQKILGVNDIFVGPKSHVSLWYDISHGGKSERQCSSGIIVSTGAGSTGWFKSLVAGARGISRGYERDFGAGAEPGGEAEKVESFSWEAEHLYFCVREPFESRSSRASIIFGRINAGEKLVVTSQSPDGGVVFSDGVESDYLAFNSGRTAGIGVAARKVRLIV